MENRTFADRYKVNCTPSYLTSFTNEEGPWSENARRIAAGLAWGREKDRLLGWVRNQMRRQLTVKQRRAIELHFFKALTFVEIGIEMNCSPSAACRTVQRGIKTLQLAAIQDGVTYGDQWQPKVKKVRRIEAARTLRQALPR